MRQLKVLGVTLVVMFAFGITATATFALPDISITLGGSYPIHLQFADNGKTKSTLETTGGSKLTSEGMSLSLKTSELSASGTFEATFLHVKEGTTGCNSSGDAAETALLSGEFHIVPLAPEGSEEGGILFSLKEVTIECGKIKVKVKGSMISTIKAGKTETEEIVQLGGKLEGSKGKNTLTKYLNDKEEEVTAILEANFGAGFVQADEAVGEEVVLEALESKMFQVQGVMPWLKSENVGGVPTLGANICEFTAAKEKCKIKFKNITTRTLAVVSVKIYGTKGEERYTKTVENCVFNLGLGECTDEIELVKLEAKTINDYCMIVKDQGNAEQRIHCLILKM